MKSTTYTLFEKKQLVILESKLFHNQFLYILGLEYHSQYGFFEDIIKPNNAKYMFQKKQKQI